MLILLLAVVSGLILVIHGVIVQEMEIQARLRRVGRGFEKMAREVEGWKS